jgi:hypothetical protein
LDSRTVWFCFFVFFLSHYNSLEKKVKAHLLLHQWKLLKDNTTYKIINKSNAQYLAKKRKLSSHLDKQNVVAKCHNANAKLKIIQQN